MSALNVRAVDVVAHTHLSEVDREALRDLFDGEYLDSHGAWNPDQPYGYAAHDVHVMARADGRVLGHVGWALREITVGEEAVRVAGVGGVLISEEARGKRLGAELMRHAARSMHDRRGIAFGYLGCREDREDIVPFYRVCGWVRIHAGERSLGRTGEPVVAPPGDPILILPIEAPLTAWPRGDIELHGRAW